MTAVFAFEKILGSVEPVGGSSIFILVGSGRLQSPRNLAPEIQITPQTREE